MISSGTKSLGSFLKDDCYYVPEYQRSYTWELNQLEDLWMDLMHLYEEQELETHFFGQIVIHNEDVTQKRYIIDGQQRLSTSIILLDAFRTMFKEFYEEGKMDAKFEVEDITTMYIGRTSEKRFEPRLFLNDTDRVFFADSIQKEIKGQLDHSTLSKLKKSELLISEANKYFLKQLRNFKETFLNQELQYREMKKLMSTFLNDFLCMTIETKDLNQAFIIFETLNARGKELAIADLLKNHVYRTSGESITDAKVLWDEMIDTLDGIDATKFIRHYWNAQYRFVRERDLYMEMRREMNTSRKVLELMNDLVRLAGLYTSLNRPSQVTYFENPVLIEKNKEMNNLGAQSYYPIIMALVIKRFSEADIIAIHDVIESFIVRNFTVSGKTANRSEKNFAGIAQKIAQGELSAASAITSSISSLIISDEEFYENFKLFEVKQSNIIRYLLRKIHNYSNNETRIIADNNTIHIEHIMPKKIGDADEWPIDADQHHIFLNRFGNLTLLGQEYNQSAVNKGFESKREIYKLSKIEMTKDLVEFSKWSIEEIESRQSVLAKSALIIWKIEK